MDASAQFPALPEHPEPAAELIILTGRLAGARRVVSGPLTLIGQGVGCDLRLLDEGVALLHCAVIADGEGPLLRDLGSPAGTNGVRPSVTTMARPAAARAIRVPSRGHTSPRNTAAAAASRP